MNFVSCNGITIHYRWIDSKKDETFVFINSLGTDFRIWEEVVEVVKEVGNILLFDKRGHGLSDVSLTTGGLQDYREDTVALLEYLSIQKCTIIGLSVGGMIAQLIAYQHAQKIKKLILCDTSYKIGNAQIWNERITSVKQHGLKSISEGVMQRWFSETFRNSQPGKVTGYKNMFERMPVVGYIQTCEAIRDAELTQIAKQLRIPALCIVGSEDKSTTPAEVKDLADLIEGSKYEVIQGSGHIPCVDNPGVLSNLIIDFIKE